MSAPMIWKLKDSHENALKLHQFMNRTDVLAKEQLDDFVKALVELFDAKTITVDGKTYAYTATLFNEALYGFIDEHFLMFDKNPFSAKIAGHLAVLTATAVREKRMQAVGDMYVVSVVPTCYTFRLHQSHLPLILDLIEGMKQAPQNT